MKIKKAVRNTAIFLVILPIGVLVAILVGQDQVAYWGVLAYPFWGAAGFVGFLIAHGL